MTHEFTGINPRYEGSEPISEALFEIELTEDQSAKTDELFNLLVAKAGDADSLFENGQHIGDVRHQLMFETYNAKYDHAQRIVGRIRSDDPDAPLDTMDIGLLPSEGQDGQDEWVTFRKTEDPETGESCWNASWMGGHRTNAVMAFKKPKNTEYDQLTTDGFRVDDRHIPGNLLHLVKVLPELEEDLANEVMDQIQAKSQERTDFLLEKIYSLSGLKLGRVGTFFALKRNISE